MTENKEDLQKQKFKKMTEEKVESLMLKLAVPSILSMLVTAFYNMADTFFVGKISTQATGAIGIVFSYMALIQAIAFFFGQGSGNYISRELGKKNVKNAEEMASSGFFYCFFTGLFLLITGYLCMTPFLRFLGATETILPEAQKYFRFILFATPFQMCSFVLNNQMRFQGNAKRAVYGVGTGAVLNVLLDPILIFGLKLGISGAAIATMVSQMVSFTILLYLSVRGDGVKIRFSNFHLSWTAMKEITAGGLPSLGRQGLASVATICLNHAVKPYGDAAIAAFAVVSRVTMIASSVVIGFGQGFQPVCGFNYGAGKNDRVKRAFWFFVELATGFVLVVSVIGFIYAKPIVAAFRKDDLELVDIGATALRYQCLSFVSMGWIMPVNMFLQTTRKTVKATIASVARQGLVFIPVLCIMQFWGLIGIQMSQMIADVISLAITIPLTVPELKKL